MEKQKIIDFVGRHVNSEGAKKELLNLKNLITSTECLISQYNTELSSMEEKLKRLTSEISTKEEKIVREASTKVDTLAKGFDLTIGENDKEIGSIEAKRNLELEELADKRNSIADMLKGQESEATINIEDLKRGLETAENKIYIFRNKEEELNKIREKIAALEKSLEDRRREATEMYGENDRDVLAVNSSSDQKINFYKTQNEVEKRKKDNLLIMFQEEKEYVMSTNVEEHHEYYYFAVKDVIALIALRQEKESLTEKREQIKSLLAEAITDKEEIVKRIAYLNEMLEIVKKEREEAKVKVSETTENVTSQAKSAFKTFRSAMTTAAEYAKKEVDSYYKEEATEVEEEKEEEPKTKQNQTLADVLSDLADEIIEDYAKATATKNNETLNDIFGMFRRKK